MARARTSIRHDPDVIRTAGERLKKRRKDLGLTQVAVEIWTEEHYGAAGKVYANQLSRLETGILKFPPSVDDLAPICAAYNLPLEEVCGWYGIDLSGIRGKRATEEPAIARAKMFLADLPVGNPAREQLLRLIDFAVTSVAAEYTTSKG